MFDFRYYVASIAGLFLMLAVGILLGVGISGRGFVDDAERDRLNGNIAQLRGELESARATRDDLERRQRAAQEFVESAYPVLVQRRLADKEIAVLVLGSVDQTVGTVERAIEDAGGRVERVRAIDVPLRVDAVESQLATRAGLGGYVGEGELGNLGRDLGRELADGGLTPLWDTLVGVIVEEQLGDMDDPVDGVVVVRTAEPQQGPTSRFLAGVYQGIGSAGVPVVGVEPARVEQSAIPAFQRNRLSTVDGIDTELGRLALVLLLGEAEPGDYGVRDTAEDGILPPLEPLPEG